MTNNHPRLLEKFRTNEGMLLKLYKVFFSYNK